MGKGAICRESADRRRRSETLAKLSDIGHPRRPGLPTPVTILVPLPMSEKLPRDRREPPLTAGANRRARRTFSGRVHRERKVPNGNGDNIRVHNQ
jgi:hypothetical protein